MSLEQNIERIAAALEAIAKGAGENNAAATQQQASPAVQVPVQAAPGMQAWQQPGTVPVQTAAVTCGQNMGQDYGMATAPASTVPVQQPQQATQPQQTPVPTTAAPQQYTFDQLAVATASLAAMGKNVFEILGKFGVNMLMDLPQEKFGEYAAALREAGAVI